MLSFYQVSEQKRLVFNSLQFLLRQYRCKILLKTILFLLFLVVQIAIFFLFDTHVYCLTHWF